MWDKADLVRGATEAARLQQEALQQKENSIYQAGFHAGQADMLNKLIARMDAETQQATDEQEAAETPETPETRGRGWTAH